MPPNLRKSLFWDVRYEDINFEKHARFVIARVLSRGNLNDWKALLSHYGEERIKREVVRIRHLDKRSFYFCHYIFDIPKENFKCYHTEPSIRKLWDY